MPKVTSRNDIEWPKLKWAISKGETKDLPEDKDAQAVILAHSDILMGEEEDKAKKESKNLQNK